MTVCVFLGECVFVARAGDRESWGRWHNSVICLGKEKNEQNIPQNKRTSEGSNHLKKEKERFLNSRKKKVNCGKRGGSSWHCLGALSCEPLHSRPPDSTDSLGVPPQGRVGTPCSPFPLVSLGSAAAATTRADCLRHQGDFLAPACLSHLAERHPAVKASRLHIVATPNPESLQSLGPERCPIHEMPFHHKLCKLSHFATLPSYLPSPTPVFPSSTSFY